MKRWIQFSAFFLIFVLILGSDYAQAVPIKSEWLALFRDAVFSSLDSVGVQKMEILCLAAYFLWLVFQLHLPQGKLGQRVQILSLICNIEVLRTTFLAVCFLSVLLVNIFSSPNTPESNNVIVLLCGLTLGQGLRLLKNRQLNSQAVNNLYENLLNVLVLLLVLSVIIGPEWCKHKFEYHDRARWSGPWDNPNIAGLLMGMGIMLAIGLFIQSLKSKAQVLEVEDRKLKLGDGSWKFGIGESTIVILRLVAVGFMICGLLHSYSRGAWLGTICGLAYLIAKSEARSQKPEFEKSLMFSCISWHRKNWFPLSVILASTFVLSFLHFGQTDWHPAKRAFSTVNVVDFSWRNRVVAWKGDLQITAEHPWFGAVWNQTEPLYEHYYLPPKLNESVAIEMNDYLMLSATLGIPALFCFGTYLWLSLIRKSEIGNRKSEITKVDWLQTTCRAGAIVLLIGFWFDGGLFKLPTAGTFWVLLELGLVELPQKSAMQTNKKF